jgi:acetylornithine/N-succinyldiaminopimelate aminotransferase
MFNNHQLFIKYIGQTSLSPLAVEIVNANGVYLYGPDGRQYIDLISGVSVSNTGHSHPRVLDAIKNQVDSHLHLMVYGEIIQASQVKYAEKLISILPKGLDNCYFVNSGSEAVEGALKLAKRYTGRSRIVSFKNAYHGSTHGALSVMGNEEFRNSFRPLLPDVFQIDFNDDPSLDLIDDKTACVIVEPVQGEAGVIYPKNDFLGKLRNRCDNTGALLIFDEIQTGFGRTGYMFAMERFKVVPDILLLAKALGGGMPLGAFIASKKVMSALTSNPMLGHITTFGGHPVSCAAGLASLNVMIDEELVKNSIQTTNIFKNRLTHSLISDIRGEGLLLAVKLVDKKYVERVIKHAPDFGLILDYFLFCDDSFRIAPPLVITEKETESACEKLISLLDFLSK